MRYRSKPSEIEAVQWRGWNLAEVEDFIPDIRGTSADMETNGRITMLYIRAGANGAQGLVPVPVGHWIVRSPDDLTDHWPVDPDYFARKYEPADDAEVAS